MNLTITLLRELVGNISFHQLPITAVFHPRAKPGLIALKNGVNARLERGPYGYQLGTGKMYPEIRI